MYMYDAQMGINMQTLTLEVTGSRGLLAAASELLAVGTGIVEEDSCVTIPPPPPPPSLFVTVDACSFPVTTPLRASPAAAVEAVVEGVEGVGRGLSPFPGAGGVEEEEEEEEAVDDDEEDAGEAVIGGSI